MNGPDPEVSHRRRPTGQPVERPAGEDPANRHVPDRADALELVEQLALVLHQLAIPHMPARVLAYALVADRDTHSAAQFAEGLGVSPAAISGALHQLMDLGLLNRTREPGVRSDLYALARQNPLPRHLASRIQRVRTAEDRLTDAVQSLGSGTPGGTRVSEALAFATFLRTQLGDAIARWQETPRPASDETSR
jgi:DNA-binding transcriptional ArsR family regulator